MKYKGIVVKNEIPKDLGQFGIPHAYRLDLLESAVERFNKKIQSEKVFGFLINPRPIISHVSHVCVGLEFDENKNLIAEIETGSHVLPYGGVNVEILQDMIQTSPDHIVLSLDRKYLGEVEAEKIFKKDMTTFTWTDLDIDFDITSVNVNVHSRVECYWIEKE